jgi:hypothetical protein
MSVTHHHFCPIGDEELKQNGRNKLVCHAQVIMRDCKVSSHPTVGCPCKSVSCAVLLLDKTHLTYKGTQQLFIVADRSPEAVFCRSHSGVLGEVPVNARSRFPLHSSAPNRVDGTKYAFAAPAPPSGGAVARSPPP